MRTDLFDVIEATWPAASRSRAGPFIIRDGAGGGKRVSAVSLEGSFSADNIVALEKHDLFSVREGQDDFDLALEQSGFEIFDPSILYSCPIQQLADQELPRVSAFEIWPPLQIMYDVWEAGGIGEARQNVMHRADCPKTSILGRVSDRAAGAAFVAVHNKVAMVHAVEVHPDHRRKGLAKLMMICAAKWGVAQKADTMALVTTQANEASKALYTSLGMSLAGSYHYRMRP